MLEKTADHWEQKRKDALQKEQRALDVGDKDGAAKHAEEARLYDRELRPCDHRIASLEDQLQEAARANDQEAYQRLRTEHAKLGKNSGNA